MQSCLKALLLKGRAVGLHADVVEGLVGALKRHVVRNEREVPVIHMHAIHLEDTKVPERKKERGTKRK